MSNKGARDVADAHFARSQSLLLSAFELLGLKPLDTAPVADNRRVSSLRGLFDTSGDLPGGGDSSSSDTTTSSPSTAAHPDSYRAFRVLLLLGNSYLAHAINRNAGIDAARRSVAPPVEDSAPPPPVGMLRRTLAMSSLPVVEASASAVTVDAVIAQLQSAAQLYERAAQFGHSDNLLLLNWAYAHQLQGQLSEASGMAMLHFNEAVRLYHTAIKLTPESPVAAKRMGISYLERVGWLRSRGSGDGAHHHNETMLLGIAERAFLDAERIEEGSAAFYLGCVAAIRQRCAPRRSPTPPCATPAPSDAPRRARCRPAPRAPRRRPRRYSRRPAALPPQTRSASRRCSPRATSPRPAPRATAGCQRADGAPRKRLGRDRAPAKRDASANDCSA
jgi:tetratricopeptide (TPR) repeat protein